MKMPSVDCRLGARRTTFWRVDENASELKQEPSDFSRFLYLVSERCGFWLPEISP